MRLETLALTKSSNNQVFAEISKDFEKWLLSDEFKEENEREKSKSKGKHKNSPLDISPARIRIKYKFLREQWRKFTDRVKMGSGKAPIEEPEWFTILNPISSDTMGDMDRASSPSDVLSHTASPSSDEEGDNDRPNSPNTSNNQDRAEESCDSADEISSETSSSSCGTKRKWSRALKKQQQKKVWNHGWGKERKTSRGFQVPKRAGRAQSSAWAEDVDIIMKFANPQPPVHYGSTQVAQQVQQSTSHSYYNHTTKFNQLPQVNPDPSQMAAPQTNHLTDLDQYQQPASGNSWY